MKPAHLQSLLIFNQADKAVIEKKNRDHFESKFDETDCIATVTDNPITPDTVISFALCNCKGNIFYLYLWGGYMITWIITFFLSTPIIFVFEQLCLSSCSKHGV